MMFFYQLTKNSYVDLPKISVPYWNVTIYGNNQILSKAWYETGERHEKFNVGDYTDGFGVRRLVSYAVFYYVVCNSYREFVKHIKKHHGVGVNEIEPADIKIAKLVFGANIEIYYVNNHR